MSETDPENPPFGETLSSRRGFDGSWVHVRVDEVRLPTGRVTTREVVEHPGSVAIVGVTGDGNVLLLRQSHHTISRTLLGITAGTLETGEAPEACARREMNEETGYRAGRMTRLASTPLADIPRHLAPGPEQIADAKTLIGLLLLLSEPG